MIYNTRTTYTHDIPALLIMAAGLGSRYGGLKQIDPIGPNGEILLEFAILDAIAIGIERVIIIISESTRTDFEILIVEKYRDRIHIDLVIQSIADLPSDISLRTDLGFDQRERVKPWGTGHAVWCARTVLGNSPFIVMNADDFYGRDALRQAYNFLVNTDMPDRHCIITCPLLKMLSEHGTVSRGICEVEDDKLVKIVEHTKVGYREKRLIHTCEDGREIELSPDAPANMNLFGFQSNFFDILHAEWCRFYALYHAEPKHEFYLLTAVDAMIASHRGDVAVIGSVSEWFGMTNPEDRDAVRGRIREIVEKK